MKKIIYLCVAISVFGCSSDNCSEEKQSINEYYENQIQQVKDNPVGGQINYRQIQLLEEERDKKLNEACN